MLLCPVLPDNDFFKILSKLDHDLFLAIKKTPCPHCGGKLDTANYHRKPRGAGELETIRYSLCCRNDGCRRRLTPSSLRFLGRKVYSICVVILAEFVDRLVLISRIARKTLARWYNFWKERLASDHPFMRMFKSFLPVKFQSKGLPSTILEVFKFRNRESWIPILNFFTHPI